MTAASENWPSRPSLFGVVPQLFRRQAPLAWLGAIFAVLLIPTLMLGGSDPRILDGAEVWMKPAKFLASLSLYALTLAWMFGYVDPAARRGPTARLIIVTVWITSVFEISYIALQAAQGERSHFNFSDPFHTAMYAAMGIAAVLLVTASLVLALLILRRPAPGLRAPYRDAVVIGLAFTTLLGGGLGGFMSTHGSHWMSAAGADSGLPLFGWSRTGGDLRPPHFLGIHAQQLIPLLALAVPGRGLPSRLAVWAIAAAYAAVTLAVFVQALNDQPLIAAATLQGLP